MAKEQDELFTYALRALGARAYSESVLRQKLLKRGSPTDADAVIARVKALGYLDDARYAEGYARLKSGKWGAGKIRQGLRAKGVAKEVVERAVAGIEADSDPIAEAIKLLERYPHRHKEEKPRAIRFLANRGYALSVAFEAWEKYSRRREA